ncbi:MAG: hypothetical protein DMF19_01660 [Verrucomicrobia bacterium]|nr:MAG: hypothetical protein DMF19_01660 [Verrucomicrobiota bacterium]
MNAARGSAERRPTKNLATSELVWRDSIEPAGNGISPWNFAISGTSEIASRRLLSIRGEPLFFAIWENLVFIHYETDPQELQSYVPYDLDCYHGGAFVSLVGFTMHGMRPRFGGRITELLLRPIATHDFLNVRTYVRHKGEPGIYFMREWLSSRIAAWLGPWSFGLPYRFGRIDYQPSRGYGLAGEHEQERRGKVEASAGSFHFCATFRRNDFDVCAPGSLDEFLLERYTAFTQFRKCRRFFRIWHEPWQQVPAKIHISADDLIRSTGHRWRKARCIGANYSPGVNVWMGWPHAIDNSDRHSVTSGKALIL